MIETVVSLGLPAGERLLVKKNVLKPMVITGSEKRVCIVTGTHGDELEGQFVCYELNRRIEEHLEYLKGIVRNLSCVKSSGSKFDHQRCSGI